MKDERKLSPAQKLERLTFADNYIFCKVMETSPEICKEMLELLLNIKMKDGTHKIFFNAKKYDTMQSGELKSFFKYLCGKEPNSDFSEKISAIVKRIKMNTRWGQEFMTWQEEVELQADLAAKKASDERAIETAQKMLDKNISVEIVAKYAHPFRSSKFSSCKKRQNL